MNLSDRRRFWTVALAIAFLAPCAAAWAADETPGKIADVWVMWPKAGHQADFEAAIKAQLAWRKSAGEPFAWSTFVPVVGDDLTFYVFRSGDHHWKDLDANTAWEMKAGAEAKFNEQVMPHVAHVVHHFSELDTDHSHWTDSADYWFFGVTSLELKSGSYAQMTEALDKVHKAAVDKNWPRSYAISWTIGGEGGMTVVNPYKSYADMADPETPFLKVLASSLGSEEAAKATMKQLSSSFEEEHYTVYAARPDLSTPK